jgi:hypothetical protein
VVTRKAKKTGSLGRLSGAPLQGGGQGPGLSSGVLTSESAGATRTWQLAVLNCALVALGSLAGCAHVPNQWVEDGPATVMDQDSPTAQDLYEHYAPAEPRRRDWHALTLNTPYGAVTHWPLWMEDPFVDKGHGREGLNRFHLGWEDYVALAYVYPRYTLNWLGLPVSMVVTPPWTLMESDGALSRQGLGYDHDATPVGSEPTGPVP